MNNYTNMNCTELRELCKERRIPNYSKMNKQALITALSQGDAVKIDAQTVAVKQPEMQIDPTREYSITENERAAYVDSKKAKFKTAEEEKAWSRTQTKECNKCFESLPLSYFGGNTSSADHFNRDGYRLRRGDCIKCNREHNKGKNEAAQIAKQMNMSQKAPEGTPCELCGRKTSIVFDHSHETKTFRGWLCDPCNRSMGVLGDDVKGLVRVLNYLNKHEKKTLNFDAETFTTTII